MSPGLTAQKTWTAPPEAFLHASRPWQRLLGVRLSHQNSARAGTEDDTDEEEIELSLIEQLLNEQVLALVFHHIPISSLGAVQCVCRLFRAAAQAPSLWRDACLEAFAYARESVNDRLLREQYQSSWKRMFLDRPHLRFDGIYVSRNTYVRTGVTEWKIRNPVHLVAYFRYLRFDPNGTLVYRTSPDPLHKVAKSLQLSHAARLIASSAEATAAAGESSSSQHKAKKQSSVPVVFSGRWKLDGDKLYTALRYDNSTSTEVRCRLKLRSTVRGANNRLDIESIVSYDREDGRSVPMAVGPAGDVNGVGDDDGIERRDYRRGTVPYVFVPMHQVNTHAVNLPPDQMDVWIPG